MTKSPPNLSRLRGSAGPLWVPLLPIALLALAFANPQPAAEGGDDGPIAEDALQADAPAEMCEPGSPDPAVPEREPGLNLDGAPLAVCSTAPLTGFWRDDHCETGPRDRGRHVVCAEVTEAFLQYTGTRGNDLVTPRPEMRFPGLRPGDRWCLCASRWEEARRAGVAPPVVLDATHAAALRYVEREDLNAHALD